MNFTAKVILITLTAVLAVLAIGVISGISLFFIIQNAENNNAKHDFKIQFSAKGNAIKDSIDSTARSVHTVKSLFDISTNLSPYEDFLPFMQNSQDNIVGAYSLGWISHVEHANRGTFINATREFGKDYSNFNIIVKPPNSVAIPAPVAPSYNVLHYIYPLAPNLGALGLNLNAEPVRSNAIKRSTASKSDAVTSIIYLPHAKYQQPGVLYLSPSYANNTLQGFGVGVFIIGDMIQSSMSDFMKESTLMIFDMGSRNSSDKDIVDGTETMWESNGYNSSSFLWSNNGEYGPDFGSVQHIEDTHKKIDDIGFSYIYSVYVGDRRWDIVISPSDVFIARFNTGLRWVGLAGAVAVAAFVSFIIFSTSAGIYIRQKNEMKIHDLEIQSEKRQAEDYKRLFNSVARIENARKHILDTIPDLIVVVNKHGKIIYANTSFCSTLGYSDVEINNNVNISSLFTATTPGFFISTMKLDFEETILETRMRQPISVSYCSFLLDIDEKEFQFDEMLHERISGGSELKKDSGVYVIVSRDLRDTKALQGELQNNRNILQQLISSSEFEKRWEEDGGTEHGRLSLDLVFGFRQKFLQFCIRNHCDENVLFLRDVEKYKNLADYDLRVKEQQNIMDSYIKVNGPRQLNLMANLQHEMELKSKRSHGEIDLFDKVITAVKTVIINDVYPRFVEEENKRNSSSSVSNTMSTASTK